MNDVLIAGAGIGGLTAALALHARGIETTVIDGATDLRPLGVGINLLPHAVAELDRLGVATELAAHAVAPRVIDFYDHRGTLLYREPRGIDGGYQAPQLSVHRGRLQALLLAEVRARLGTESVRTGHRLLSFDESRDRVEVRTSAGHLSAGLLVGADGIHSAVRAQLHPDGDGLQWSGVRMYRGATRTRAFLDGATMAIVKGDGVEVVIYPIGAGEINWVVQVDSRLDEASGPLPGDAAWNAPGDPDTVLAKLADFDLEWLDLEALVRGAETVLEYPMVDRDPLPWWSAPDGHGRVTLLGDAAHPMYPVGANGGSQSIVDARVLADELARDPRHGLHAYETRRRPETATVVAANREMLKVGAAGDDLADVMTRYRHDTNADRRL